MLSDEYTDNAIKKINELIQKDVYGAYLLADLTFFCLEEQYRENKKPLSEGLLETKVKLDHLGIVWGIKNAQNYLAKQEIRMAKVELYIIMKKYGDRCKLPKEYCDLLKKLDSL